MRRKAAERAIALGEDDPLVYVLAEKLGKHLHEIEAMSHAEAVRWTAWLTWRAVQEQHQHDVAAMRARRK